MTSEYVPLSLPVPTGTQNFTTAAQFLEQSAQAIAVSGNSYIADLTDLKAIDFSQVGDLPAFNGPILATYLVGVGDRPVRPTVDTNFQYLLDRLNALAAPATPTPTFSYTDPGYSSAMRDAMSAKLLNDLLNGGYGIDTIDEVTLWNRERDREVLLMQGEIEEIRRQAAAMSFPMPQGVLFAQLEKARQKYMEKISSANRDIGLKRADLYVQHRQRTLENVLKTEDQSIGLYNAIQGRALEAAQVLVKMTLAIFEAGMRAFELQISALLKQITAKVDVAQMSVQLYASDVNAYAAYVNALATQSRVAMESSKMTFERDKTKYLSNVEIVRFRLEQLKATVEKSRQINEFGVEFFRTGLGAAMSGINGLAVQSGTV